RSLDEFRFASKKCCLSAFRPNLQLNASKWPAGTKLGSPPNLVSDEPFPNNFRLCRKAWWDRFRLAADTGECYVLRAAQIVVNDGKSCRLPVAVDVNPKVIVQDAPAARLALAGKFHRSGE